MSASACVLHASWDPTCSVAEPGNQTVLETEGIPGEVAGASSGTNRGKATDTKVAEAQRIVTNKNKMRAKASRDKGKKANNAKQKAQRRELRPLITKYKTQYKWGSK